MRNDETGFSTPFAMLVIFSLFIIVLSFSMLVVANERKVDSYRKDIEARKEVDIIIYAMEQNLQALKDFPCDMVETYSISSLLSSVCDYSFSVHDVSTGINKNFFAESFFENEAIREYVLTYGDSVFTDFGWVNLKYADRGLLDSSIKDFGNKNPFPLVNALPPYNIYYMNEAFIKTILKLCNIKNVDEKAALIKARLSGEISIKELGDLIDLSETHPVFDLLGTKTSFWKIDFETKKCSVSVIFGAVPDLSNQRTIEKYILVKKDISYKRGIL